MTDPIRYTPSIFEAPALIANQIDEMEIGVITSIDGIAGEELWKTYNHSERAALNRIVKALVVAKLLPLERVGYHGEGQNLYRRTDA